MATITDPAVSSGTQAAAAVRPGTLFRAASAGVEYRQRFSPQGARLLFLPPYSPDLNPIEQLFAKLKHLMRQAAERTVEATWKRTGSLLDCFKPDECQRCLVNAGYAST